MERRSFLKAMAAAVAFPFSALKLRAQTPPPVPNGRIITGWPAFDEALGGGFERNHFVVLKHDASVNENWFLWNLKKHNGPDAADIWQFEPNPDDYLVGPGGGKYPTTARQACRWYRLHRLRPPPGLGGRWARRRLLRQRGDPGQGDGGTGAGQVHDHKMPLRAWFPKYTGPPLLVVWNFVQQTGGGGRCWRFAEVTFSSRVAMRSATPSTAWA